MTRLIRVAALCLVVALGVSAIAADSAPSLFNKGREAEARQDYDAAYTFFKQAWEKKPKDARYKAYMERLRFEAAAQHVHKGQLLREDGKLEEALAQFERAAVIDPSSFIARQEIRRTRDLIEKAKSAPAGQVPKAPESPLARRIEEASGPVELTKLPNVPVTLKMTGDTREIYDAIGRLAGINVLYDPDLTPRRVRFELNNEPLENALQLLALESRTFWRAVTPNTIFVAQDTPEKRRTFEQEVIRTFYLNNASGQSEINDIVNTLRAILTPFQKVQALISQNAIVARGTVDQLALAEKLINDLDKPHSEVVVDVAVIQVSRSKLRDLGISPPTSATIQLNPNVSNTTSSGTTTTTSTQGSISLNHIGNLTAKDFSVSFGPATINALLSDNNTKLLQNPQVRALDGQKASLKIGDRVPVATGSFGAGIGGVGLNSLVNTQFNYIDVGVNIDMTPAIHGDNEVTLKVVLDVSSVTSQQNIGGINQPVIGQRKVDHTIRLRNGEVNMIGGIFEDNNVKAISGIPGVSQIPILRYLFSSEHTEHTENEIVFLMIPHIVRGRELTPLNIRPIEVGTQTTTDLRRAMMPAPAATPAPGMPTTPQGTPGAAPTATPQATPTTPNPHGGATPPGGGATMGTGPAMTPQQQSAARPASATLGFTPPLMTQTVGSTFSVDVVLNGQNVHTVPMDITYDPRMLQLVNISNGTLLARDGQAVALTDRRDDAAGTVRLSATRPPNTGGISGQGSVFTLTFLAKGTGQSAIAITRAAVQDPNSQTVQVTGGAQAQVTVK